MPLRRWLKGCLHASTRRYPENERSQRLSDATLADILTSLDLGHLMTVRGGLSAVKAWDTWLSVGEQQRLGEAGSSWWHVPAACLTSTIWYARPCQVLLACSITNQRWRYWMRCVPRVRAGHTPCLTTRLIVQQATSALDVALEARVMRLCHERRIACVSVGHRPTLLPHHDCVYELRNGSLRRVRDVSTIVQGATVTAPATTTDPSADSATSSSEHTPQATGGARQHVPPPAVGADAGAGGGRGADGWNEAGSVGQRTAPLVTAFDSVVDGPNPAPTVGADGPGYGDEDGGASDNDTTAGFGALRGAAAATSVLSGTSNDGTTLLGGGGGGFDTATGTRDAVTPQDDALEWKPSSMRLNAVFWRRAVALFKVGFPRFISKPVGVLLLNLFVNIIRSVVVVGLAFLAGPMYTAIVADDYAGLIRWAFIALAVITSNCLLQVRPHCSCV